MSLGAKLLNPSLPVVFFEVVPPAANKPEAVEAMVAEMGRVRLLADAINLPEIRDESPSRGGARTSAFVPRVEPRTLGARLRRELGVEVVVNRAVVYEPDPLPWFRETHAAYGIADVVLVGRESSRIAYPGPSVTDAAEQVRAAQLPISLGGITIPSRVREAERIRRKHAAGLTFFTTQILFDPNDIVWLIQRLNGLEARIFLSFAPVSHPRDLEFLRWLGADIPPDLDRFLLLDDGRRLAPPERCLERSLDLAQRILMEVFDNLPPDPPLIGLNVEHINRRNWAPAMAMLERLGNLYADLVLARARV